MFELPDGYTVLQQDGNLFASDLNGIGKDIGIRPASMSDVSGTNIEQTMLFLKYYNTTRRSICDDVMVCVGVNFKTKSITYLYDGKQIRTAISGWDAYHEI